jgi:hypothetical protein
LLMVSRRHPGQHVDSTFQSARFVASSALATFVTSTSVAASSAKS